MSHFGHNFSHDGLIFIISWPDYCIFVALSVRKNCTFFKTDFREFFLVFTASVRSRPPGPPQVPGVLLPNPKSRQGTETIGPVCLHVTAHNQMFHYYNTLIFSSFSFFPMGSIRSWPLRRASIEYYNDCFTKKMAVIQSRRKVRRSEKEKDDCVQAIS